MTRAISEFSAIIDREERHREHVAVLRSRYGAAAPGRAVLEHARTVEADEKHLIAGIKAATDKKARELHLMIDGPGGLTASMGRIIDALDGFKGVKRGIVVGRCSSATAVIFAACDERIAPPTAEIMVHCCGFGQFSDYQPPRYTAASLDREAARLAGIDIRIADVFVRRTGSRALEEMISDGGNHHLTAAEARALNLVTRIEPADATPITGPASAALHYSPRRASARAALASMARMTGRAGPPFVALRLQGEIGPGKPVNAASIRRQLAAAPNANTLTVFINSIGGDLHEAWRIYGLIREHPATRKKATASVDCASAAILPFLACDVRSAFPSAQLLLHPAAINPFDHRDRRWTAAQLSAAAEQAARSDAAYADVLAERTGYDREWFVAEMRRDRPVPLPDALKAGIIHEIIGVTSAPDPTWPERTRAMTGAVVGFPSYMLSDSYLAACRAARPR